MIQCIIPKKIYKIFVYVNKTTHLEHKESQRKVQMECL